MVRVAVWLDTETELLCAFVLLPGAEFSAVGSCFAALAEAIEHEVARSLPQPATVEIGFLHLGPLPAPVLEPALRRRLERAIAVG